MNSLKETNKSRIDGIKIHTHPRGLEKYNSPIQVGSVAGLAIKARHKVGTASHMTDAVQLHHSVCQLASGQLVQPPFLFAGVLILQPVRLPGVDW